MGIVHIFPTILRSLEILFIPLIPNKTSQNFPVGQWHGWGEKFADCGCTISRFWECTVQFQDCAKYYTMSRLVCSFRMHSVISQIPRLHGTETLDLFQCNHPNPYNTMEPELSCLISPRCELGESHAGNVWIRDQELSQRDLDNPTCNFSFTHLIPHETMPTN